jgi:uncharacterized repeat protein (TIGR01451 family)
MRTLLPFLALAVAPGAAQAADPLALRSNVFVERTEVADGRTRITLTEPATVTPGDRLVFVLHYRNTGNSAASGLVVTNPMHPSVAYQDADGAQVSVDGGKSWGTLAAARVRTARGDLRPARPDDVTHIRWQLAGTLPAGGSGNLRFRGTVR